MAINGPLPIYGQHASTLSIPPPPPPPPRTGMNGQGGSNALHQQQSWQNGNRGNMQTSSQQPNGQTYGVQEVEHDNFINVVPPLMPNPNMTGPSPDILGIAEKASAAVKALSAQNNFNRQVPNPQNQHPTINSLQQQQYPGHGGFTNNGIKDLGISIQAAVKNLQDNGFLDPTKELGPSVCRLLRQLPEPVALQNLEKFSLCDSSIMRSKEGYLVGILKKALQRL